MKKFVSQLAFDRGTVRTTDVDGRLHVEITNISKANVCPYFGHEIPGGAELGLIPDKIYQLLRDPGELEKAAPTFNNIPLLDRHIPVHVEEPQKDAVVGSTGTDAVFAAPYLRNSLVIWTADAIAGIESGEQREISCAYRYVADMTPGNFEGTPYDGVMREIRGNHVALVETGRAGPDVIVGDSQPEGVFTMSKKALSTVALLALGGLMALDSSFAAGNKPDLPKLLADLNAKNFKAKKAGIVGALKQKLAADADLDDVVALLDKLEEKVEAGSMDDDLPLGEGGATKPEEKEGLSIDGEGLSEEEETQYQALLKRRKPAGAADEPPPFKGKPEVSKGAMDAAIKASEDSAVARINAMHAALDEVKPFVGKLVAMDSAEAVYRAALTQMDVDVTGVHASALRHILLAQKKPDTSVSTAFDSAASKGFAEKFGAVAGRVAQL